MKRAFLTVFIIVACLLPGYSQTFKLQGVVTDRNSEPIIGATVRLLNNNIGTVTDIEGKFQLSVPQKGQLQISYVGYQLQKIHLDKVNLNSVLKITLNEDSETLDELVVIGYATQKKASLTGAISVIDNKELMATRNENVVNMLAGKIPGLRVKQFGGEPGSFESSFDIRGMGTPLIVIDGIPRDASDFQRMDPSDIESVSVLKDASAAIYGVKAANGVVLVTTKKGSSATSGKVDINYSINQGWQYFLNVPEAGNVYQFMELINEKKQREHSKDYGNSMPEPYYSKEVFDMYRNGTLQETNWSDLVMRDFAPQVQHNLSLNGSSEKIDYYFNLGYSEQGGNFKSNAVNYNRWNFRSNTTVKIMKGLKGNVSLSGYWDNKNHTTKDVWVVYKNIWMQMPTQEAYANNNPLYPSVTPDNDNPVVITDPDIVGYRVDQKKAFQGQLSLEYDFPFLKGLRARVMYNYDYNITDKKLVKKSYNLYTYNREKDSYTPSLCENPSLVNRNYSPSSNEMLQLQLSYDNTFINKHHVGGMLVYEESTNNWDNINAQRNISLPIYELFAGDVKDQQGSSSGLGEEAKKALIGRFTYDYSSKYLFEFSFRYDGSSRFSPQKHWGFFPAASIGWRINEERFIKESPSLSFINNLKLRSSYGIMGDDGAISYQFLSGYTYPYKDNGYILGGDFVNGLKSRGVPNPYLTWFESKTFNVGLDIELWNGLLGATAEYFIRNRSGLLSTRVTTIPGTVGVNLPQENLDSDKTFGYELLLTHRNRIGDLGYNVSFNMSAIRDMKKHVESLPYESSYDNWRNNQNNRYTNIWWGKEYAGQFTSYNQIQNHPIQTNAVPGDYYYKDWNNDGVINEFDEHPIATKGMPLFNYGLSIAADWKNFDLSLVFQGTSQHYVEFDGAHSNPCGWDRNSLVKFMDRWHTKDPNANMYDPTTEWIAGYYPTTGSGNSEGEGTRAVQNASYVRLKSAELGYTFPKKWMKAASIKGLRVFLTGYNLLTFTGLRNYDPEHPGKQPDGEPWYGGGSNYPINGSINVGAKITF